MKALNVLLFFFILGVNAQSIKLAELEKTKNELSDKISLLNDSISKIDRRILALKSEGLLNQISDSTFIAKVSPKAKMRNTPIGNVILQFEGGENVTILSYKNGFFSVCFDSICGFMSDVWIIRDDRINNLIMAVYKLEREKKIEEKKEKAIAKKERRIEINKEERKYFLERYGAEILNKLEQGKYWLGMTDEMARFSLGNPKDVNRSVGSYGAHEQWVYSSNRYFYFENGVLTSYQN